LIQPGHQLRRRGIVYLPERGDDFMDNVKKLKTLPNWFLLKLFNISEVSEEMPSFSPGFTPSR